MRRKKCFREKLNNKGASVILALVVFLIVAFVAIAIVNAAILNAERTAEERKVEIAYSATTEAIRLIQNCMEDNASFVYDKEYEGQESNSAGTTAVEGMKDELGVSVKEMAKAGGGTKNITFSYSGTELLKNAELKGRITMSKDYTITVDVWMENAVTDYPLTLTIPGTAVTVKEDDYLKPKDSNGKFQKKEVTYISWSKDGMYVTSRVKDKNGN